jgi:hypothetical protein
MGFRGSRVQIKSHSILIKALLAFALTVFFLATGVAGPQAGKLLRQQL